MDGVFLSRILYGRSPGDLGIVFCSVCQPLNRVRLGFRAVIDVEFVLMLYNHIVACYRIHITVYAILVNEKLVILRELINRYKIFSVCGQANLILQHLPDIVPGIVKLKELRKFSAGNDLLPVFLFILI